ncbi:Protein CBG24434 [Caenorhabditis briggsae]|uniref:Protein CBG24434 n=1 Tax=Caenorhabditis briggsae TaxID=6238 RepID=A8WKQ0_CAEBR|nr:Protein CBG24434 [Caenorhabditis briggsae]CAP21045.1 Protein CBG24434 [Caenorhabditis briggsae]
MLARKKLKKSLKNDRSRRPATTEGFKVPVLPPNIKTLPPDTPHGKRAAPPSPRKAKYSPVLNQKSDNFSYDSRHHHPIRVACTFSQPLFLAKTPSEASIVVINIAKFSIFLFCTQILAHHLRQIDQVEKNYHEEE